MKTSMSAASLRDVAVNLLRDIASIPRRRYFWLLLAAIAGYSYGYRDAFRGPESLAWKVGDLLERVAPASVNEARRRNAEALRQLMRANVELPQVDSSDSR
jgi:hypothetical protein